MSADAILHPDWSTVDPALSTIVLHVRTGMGGTWVYAHAYMAQIHRRLSTYSKYQGLVSVSQWRKMFLNRGVIKLLHAEKI